MKLFLLFVAILVTNISYGQKGYFLTDTKDVYGVEIIDGGDLINSQFCLVKDGGEIIEYTPYEVSEYGFKEDGRVYISRVIRIANSSKKVFLERLHEGETSLYSYTGKDIVTFYIEKDSTLFVELPKRNMEQKDYSEQLLYWTRDCPNVSDACKLVTYNKNSLTKLISRYNQCELKPFPFFKYGVLFGYEFSKLIPTFKGPLDVNYFDYNYAYEGGFSVGLFFDNPIDATDYSVHTELLLSKHGYSYSRLVGNQNFDFVANLTSINVPILIRYAYPSNVIRPFINIGVNGTYFIENKSLLHETTISESIIEINDTEISPIINDFQWGYIIGGGLEYKLNYKNSLFLELRFNNQYNIGDSKFKSSSVFNILTGISF